MRPETSQDKSSTSPVIEQQNFSASYDPPPAIRGLIFYATTGHLLCEVSSCVGARRPRPLMSLPCSSTTLTRRSPESVRKLRARPAAQLQRPVFVPFWWRNCFISVMARRECRRPCITGRRSIQHSPRLFRFAVASCISTQDDWVEQLGSTVGGLVKRRTANLDSLWALCDNIPEKKAFLQQGSWIELKRLKGS